MGRAAGFEGAGLARASKFEGAGPFGAICAFLYILFSESEAIYPFS